MKEFVEMLYLIREPVILSEDNYEKYTGKIQRISYLWFTGYRLYIWEIDVFDLNGKVRSLS
ncbi:hypothetical protein [Bacillus mycoides]|uniref:hypothetical protein n=2 Tax=Bacillus cereus group TaxID=86661 RepID=UPI0002EFEF16|nr:hypothetical protein [Bacillus mycoides]